MATVDPRNGSTIEYSVVCGIVTLTALVGAILSLVFYTQALGTCYTASGCAITTNVTCTGNFTRGATCTDIPLPSTTTSTTTTSTTTSTIPPTVPAATLAVVYGACCGLPRANATTTTAICVDHTTALACSAEFTAVFATSSFYAGGTCTSPGVCEQAVVSTACCAYSTGACTQSLASTNDCTGTVASGTCQATGACT